MGIHFTIGQLKLCLPSKEKGCSNHGAEQRSLHLFGSRSEMSSVSHYASENAGKAQPEVYEKQREREEIRIEQIARESVE